MLVIPAMPIARLDALVDFGAPRTGRRAQITPIKQ
jgi:hypothetical protein